MLRLFPLQQGVLHFQLNLPPLCYPPPPTPTDLQEVGDVILGEVVGDIPGVGGDQLEPPGRVGHILPHSGQGFQVVARNHREIKVEIEHALS